MSVPAASVIHLLKTDTKINNKILRCLQAIQKLHDQDKAHIFELPDTFLRDRKNKTLMHLRLIKFIISRHKMPAHITLASILRQLSVI